MNRESIVDKVRKLRALSEDKSTTLEEAAAAARAAELLIQRHALEEAELGVNQELLEAIIEDTNPLTNWGQRQKVWQNILLHALSENYNCSNVLKYKDGAVNLFTIGRPSDIVVLRYQFAYFVLELTRLAHLLAPTNMGRGEGKTWHNSFYRGAVSAIITSLKEARQEVRAQSSSTALVFIDQRKQEVEQVKAQLYPDARVKTMGGRVDPDAYRVGQQAGSNLHAKPALGVDGARLLNK